jgi:hypothetical protein
MARHSAARRISGCGSELEFCHCRNVADYTICSPDGETRLATAHKVDVVSILWASMALFDGAARDVDTTVLYRPPWHDLHSPLAARQRILAMLGTLPDGALFERFLPPIDPGDDRSSRAGLRRRCAWASTLLAGLELLRAADVTLIQEAALTTVHLMVPTPSRAGTRPSRHRSPASLTRQAMHRARPSHHFGFCRCTPKFVSKNLNAAFPMYSCSSARSTPGASTQASG